MLCISGIESSPAVAGNIHPSPPPLPCFSECSPLTFLPAAADKFTLGWPVRQEPSQAPAVLPPTLPPSHPPRGHTAPQVSALISTAVDVEVDQCERMQVSWEQLRGT